MRVLFSSTRGTGHLQPLLPYAKALAARGHEILVAGPQELREAVLGAGLEHAPFGHPGDAGLAPLWARLRSIPAEEQVAVVVREIFAGANARAAFPDLLETIRAWQPQLIVRDSAEFAAIVAAKVARVPHARVAVHHRAMEEQICALAAAAVDKLREAAGLAGDEGASLRVEPIFTAFPESFEGPATSGVSGPVVRVGCGVVGPPSASSGWRPDGDGLPFVYITFGTIAATVPEALVLYQTAVAAVAQLPVRALLTTGRSFDVATLGAIPANLQVEAWVPQAEVFPHTAVLVCHGGSGTVLGGLAAGIPQVVVPIGADQPQNAQSVAAIGAGLALTKPDTETLRAAIQRVLDDATFRRAARAISTEMAALPRVDAAVEALLELAAHRV
jgi:UDP:flavonoid glycosyltransferase YjiC (YdhE family)